MLGSIVVLEKEFTICLDPIPKTDRVIAHYPFHSQVTSVHKKNKNKLTITRIPDSLWDGIIAVLPAEKPNNTIGRPIVPFRKAMDGIVCVLRTGCHWKMLPREYGSVQHATGVFRNGSG